MGNIPLAKKQVKENNSLSRTESNVFDFLCGSKALYSRLNKLAYDGSFFKNNATLIKKCAVSRCHVHRIKKSLQSKGYIRYSSAPGRGLATKYWIITKAPEEEIINAPLAALDVPGLLVLALSLGKTRTIEKYQEMGYSKEEIEQALDRK